tara:strand:- start:409 stop:564 length:156 start_codon:yes stop_codon:yes gene_type:complete
MSFGGSNGSTGVSAHVHSNAVGEGGALNSTQTLMDTALLNNTITIRAVTLG